MLSLLLSVIIGVKLHFSGSEVHRRDFCPVTCEPRGMMLGRCLIHYLM